MTAEEAKLRIQKEIDKPLITSDKKSQLFSIYQNLNNIESNTVITPELNNVIETMCPKD